jgi:suppressor of tumorigenicity protein 13
MEAVSAYGEGNFEESVAKYTEAIKLNGGSAILFAKRGQAYIQLQKPKACIRVCNRALQINPDSAVAFKFRGRAHRLLGNWVESASDLRQACKIDFDEQADIWLKEVTPNARKLEEYGLRKKRRDEERDIKLRKRKAQERARAHEEAKSSTPFAEEASGPGMEDFMGKAPGLDKLMNDPEVVELFSDPEVAAAFNDIGQNPMNILKYQSNPKVSKLLQILQKKMGGMGGFPGMGGMGGGMPFGGAGGGMPGGFGGFGGMPGFGSAGQAPPDSTSSQGGAEDLD